MTTRHLTEMELQQYALDKSACATEVADHIAACENCRAAVKMYGLLFLEIKQEPKAAFDFDVSTMVLSQIPSAKPKISTEKIFFYLFAALGFFIAAIPLYLFRKNISYVFTDISNFFLYTIIAAVLFTILFRVLDMYRKYQRQMESLNIY